MGQLAGHTYVTRPEWGARPPTSPLVAMPPGPTPRLWIHHSADDRQGAAAVRAHQRYHQDTREWKDIAYNFLGGADGTIFEGRGARIVGGATAGDNPTSHAICLLGNFETYDAPAAQWQALVDLARHGDRVGWWVPTCGGHRDAPGAETACPGRHVYARLDDLRGDIANPPTPQEEDMTPDECRAVVRSETQRLAQYLATGQGNQAFNPGLQPWMSTATTLPRLAAAVRASGADVDEAELARQLLPALGPDAIAQALVDAGVGDHVVDAIHRRTAPTG